MSDLIAPLSPVLSDWLVLQTLVGQEPRVAERLQRHFMQEQEVVHPRRKLKIRRQGEYLDSEKTLFPGYIFFRGHCDDPAQFEERILMLTRSRRELPGMIKILGQGRRPVPIYEHEARLIWAMMDAAEIIDYSQACYEGARVRIVGGPLLGREGIIRKLNRRKGRATVEMTLFGAVNHTDLGVEYLELEPGEAAPAAT